MGIVSIAETSELSTKNPTTSDMDNQLELDLQPSNINSTMMMIISPTTVSSQQIPSVSVVSSFQSIEQQQQLPPKTTTSTLRETHIFTPSKGMTSVSRDVSEKLDDFVIAPMPMSSSSSSSTTVAADESEFSDFQSSSEIKINKNVITKEYRDIEYDPDKNLKKPEVSILQPTKIKIETVPSSGIVINWPDPGNVSQNFDNFSLSNDGRSQRNSDDFEFTDFQGTNTIKYDPRDEEDVFQNVIAINPIEEPIKIKDEIEIDDEFTDFQYVPPSSLSATSTSTTILPQPITVLPTPLQHTQPKTLVLTPMPTTIPFKENKNEKSNQQQSHPSTATFMPNYSKTNFEVLNPMKLSQTMDGCLSSASSKINWPDPGIDSEEAARVAAAFSHKKTDMKHKTTLNSTNSKEEDEWNDFVSSGTIQLQSSQSRVPTTTPKDDDFGDFVSSTPTNSGLGSIQTVSGSTSYKWGSSQGPPSFSSWNSTKIGTSQQLMGPPKFNSWNQPNQFLPNLSSNTSTSTSSSSSSKTSFNNGLILNPLSSISSTINASSNIASSSSASALSSSQQQQKNINQKQQIPNIALIPDLSFIAPKTLINVPRTNLTKK